MNHNQKGAIDMLLLAAIAAAVIVGGLVLYRISDTEDIEPTQQTNAGSSEEVSEQETEPEETYSIPEGWVEYERLDKGFSLFHPPNWIVDDSDEYTNLDAPETSLNIYISSESDSEWSGRYEGGIQVSNGAVVSLEVFYIPGRQSAEDAFNFNFVDNPIEVEIGGTTAYFQDEVEKKYYIYNDPYRLYPVLYHDSVDNPGSQRAVDYTNTFDLIIQSISFNKPIEQ